MRARILALALSLPWLATGAFAQTNLDGHWQGAIHVPGAPLGIDVDFASDDAGVLTGDISIPIQKLRDVGLIDVALEGSAVRFAIPGIPGNPSFEGTVDAGGGQISGTFRQGGAELEFELVRGDAPAARAAATLDGFGAVIEKALADFNTPGFAMAVVAAGEVVWAQGFGHRDVEAGKPMTADTLFAIGSTTKAMTSTLLGMLVDEGKLEWDEPLREFLPGFELADPMVSERLTPRDLVTHRSGLPRHDLLWYNNDQGTRAELIERFEHLELSADLRAKFQYNNLMYMTAGYLAGQLSGTTWEEAMRQRLFTPLGMTRTNFSVVTSQQDDDFAYPYRENDDHAIERIPFRKIDLIGPAGSVNSSVNEMSRWLLLNLRGGKVGDRQIVNASTLADIHSPHMPTGATSDRIEISQPTYGMGWMIDTYRGHRRVHHGGGIDGFATTVVLFPDDDLGLVAFNNGESAISSLLTLHAADLLLGLDPMDWLGEAKVRRDKSLEGEDEAERKKATTRVAGTTPSHALADYAGDYDNPGYGRLTIALAGESLEVSFNGITAPLEHWHYDVWNGAETEGDETFEDMKFLFRGDVDGNVAAVESIFEARAEPIVFAKRPDSRLSDPEYLARFVGTYELETEIKLAVELAGDALTLTVPGQLTYHLEPALSGRFTFAEARVVSVEFVVENSGAVSTLLLHQPQGVFEATRVEGSEPD